MPDPSLASASSSSMPSGLGRLRPFRSQSTLVRFCDVTGGWERRFGGSDEFALARSLSEALDVGTDDPPSRRHGRLGNGPDHPRVLLLEV